MEIVGSRIEIDWSFNRSPEGKKESSLVSTVLFYVGVGLFFTIISDSLLIQESTIQQEGIVSICILVRTSQLESNRTIYQRSRFNIVAMYNKKEIDL